MAPIATGNTITAANRLVGTIQAIGLLDVEDVIHPKDEPAPNYLAVLIVFGIIVRFHLGDHVFDLPEENQAATLSLPDLAALRLDLVKGAPPGVRESLSRMDLVIA